MKRLLGKASGTVIGLLAAATVLAAPKAEIASTAWQLDFRFHDIQRIILTLPGDKEPTTYWYLVYEVANRGDRDVPFYPSFRLVTDTLQVVEGGAAISPTVYEAIKARHKDEFPFLAPSSQVTGMVLRGTDNARASVAVFQPFDPEASEFTVYVAGLSGEIERVGNPAFDFRKEESESNPRFFVLRRTLAIRYAIPGDAETTATASAVRRSRTWVMR